jgi:osmotically-inducible protein OsmY
MNVVTGERIIVGTAVMTLCLGMPLMAQAGSSYDYGYRSDHVQRGWSDSRPRDDANRDRYDDGRQFYTDQYGDLDTELYEERKRMAGQRTDGRWTDEGYRSNTSSQTPRYRNELRRADETLKRNILEELGGDYENVQVEVRDGIAILSGSVLDRSAMVSAVHEAYDAGAQKVVNHMEVFRLEDRPWENMSDRNLARAVQKELSWSPFVDSDPIRVTARDGVVTLEGSVEDRSEMAAAEKNAYEAGARRVENRLRMNN